MSAEQLALSQVIGRPRTSSHPPLSRRYAREWFWHHHSYDTYQCPRCGRGIGRVYQFDVHHADGDPTNNDPHNLMALCHRCHVWEHLGATISALDTEEWKAAFLAAGRGR